jgi:hypothetical protein
VCRGSRRGFVPWAFAVSAVLLVFEWTLLRILPTIIPVVVYLHISGIGPILGSGFWLVVSECFDPRTAKRSFGQIVAAGTIGGLLGGLLAERVAVLLDIGAMLPVLALLNLACAWQVSRLAPPRTAPRHSSEFSPELTPEPAWAGVRVLAERPYLRHLALLVLLGTTSAALIDYLFKAQAVSTFGTGENLLRFFAIYYAAVSLVTVAVQAALNRLALEHMGLALTTATPSLALMAGSLGALAAPGLESAMVARGGETVFRNSLFRSAYEVFYTPVPVGEKRAAKSIIDVGFDRLGDAVGGTAIRFILLLAPAVQHTAIMAATIVSAAAGAFVASRLNRGYIQTLEQSLRDRADEVDLSDVRDLTTRTAILNSTWRSQTIAASLHPTEPDTARPGTQRGPTTLEPEVLDIMRLRSRDRDRVRSVLRRGDELTPALIPHVLPLLAWDPVADDAIASLRQVAPRHVGKLADALLDPYEEFAVRRRIPRVLSVCRSQRAVDSLLLGLDDIRFEVRFQCARSLATIVAAQADVRIESARVFEVVQKEVAVGRPVWEGRHLLDGLDEGDSDAFVDEFIRNRATRSLAHVFTLLSLVLPAEPLQIALRGLYVEDQNLRGTALEYLESVLPPIVRDPLWPFLEDRRAARPSRGHDDIVADLVRSNHSIMLNLKELKRRADQAEGKKREGQPT